MMSDIKIFLNTVILFFNLIILKAFYRIFFSRNRNDIECGNVVYSEWELKADSAFGIANLFLTIGIVATVLLIYGSGGIKHFLALGQSARGIEVNISEKVGSNLTPFVLLSQVILVSPYVYYLLSKKGYKKAKPLFLVSVVFAGVYLLFNQGKGPLLLSLIPFLLDKEQKKSLLRIGMLVFLAFLISPLLDALFRYITYGDWIYSFDINDIPKIFWGYYSLSFANFSYRHQIVEYMGMRWGIDYLNWIYLLIPNSFLKLIGLSKVGFVSLVQYNTAALQQISGIQFSGGLPMDFSLFNYVQFGLISFFLAEIFFMKVLSSVDARMQYENRYDVMRIVHYRLAIGVMMVFSSYTFESLFRCRLDIIILLFSYMSFFTYRKGQGIRFKILRK